MLVANNNISIFINEPRRGGMLKILFLPYYLPRRVIILLIQIMPKQVAGRLEIANSLVDQRIIQWYPGYLARLKIGPVHIYLFLRRQHHHLSLSYIRHILVGHHKQPLPSLLEFKNIITVKLAGIW